MLDVREQIKTALSAVCNNVKMQRPEGDVTLPLVCYGEQGNTPVAVGHVRLRWRVAVYHQTFADLVSLVNAVDDAMTALGYTRTGKTPDENALVGTDLYLCRLDYSAIANTIDHYIIKGSR